jgi:ABC-type sugar transport system substrate-binding protein
MGIRTRVGRLAAIATIGIASVGVAACGSDDTSTSGGGEEQQKGTGKLDGGGKQLVYFSLSSSNSYIAEHNKQAKAEAAKLGYKMKIFENNFDQAQQDQQVSQFLASGQKPAAILWWPNNSQAGINATRQLSRIAPVVQTNQLLLPEGRKYVKFYVGVNDKLIGTDSAKNLIQAREEDRKAGKKLNSKEGNLLIFRFAEGYLAGDDRTNAFLAETKSDPFNVLLTEPMPTPDAQSGYKAASALIPKYKSQGIDYVFSNNNNSLVGIARALKENGLTPGKDVQLSGGDCSGNMEPFKKGEIYGSVLQPPGVEGKLLARTTAAHLATGKVTPGTFTYDQSVDTEPEATMEPPHQYTFMPAGQMIGGDALSKPAIWGLTADEACF